MHLSIISPLNFQNLRGWKLSSCTDTKRLTLNVCIVFTAHKNAHMAGYGQARSMGQSAAGGLANSAVSHGHMAGGHNVMGHQMGASALSGQSAGFAAAGGSSMGAGNLGKNGIWLNGCSISLDEIELKYLILYVCSEHGWT